MTFSVVMLKLPEVRLERADYVLQCGGRFDNGGGFSGRGMSIEGNLRVGEGDERNARAWLTRSTALRRS